MVELYIFACNFADSTSAKAIIDKAIEMLKADPALDSILAAVKSAREKTDNKTGLYRLMLDITTTRLAMHKEGIYVSPRLKESDSYVRERNNPMSKPRKTSFYARSSLISATAGAEFVVEVNIAERFIEDDNIMIIMKDSHWTLKSWALAAASQSTVLRSHDNRQSANRFRSQSEETSSEMAMLMGNGSRME